MSILKKVITPVLRLGGCHLRCQRVLTVRLMSSITVDKWKIYTGVCLERMPRISAEMTDLEKRFAEFLEKLEFDNSLLSDHELRGIQDEILAERRKSDDYEETEADAVRQTALDMEDIWEQELQDFKFASRVTAADKSGNLKTSNRKLDRKLVLLVKQQLGTAQHWVLPKMPLQENETLRQGAERTLSALCGSNLKAQLMGNAPVGYLQRKFAKPAEDGSIGMKVFFMKAHLLSGSVDIKNTQEVSDYMWLTKEEMASHLNESYNNKVNKFIVDY